MLVRPGSVAKPTVADRKASGVEIRVGDLTDDYAELKEHLQGVDILISAVDGRIITKQREIIRAAKEVGVQRVVPCEWATPGKKGFHVITDMVRQGPHLTRRSFEVRYSPCLSLDAEI